MVNGESIDGYKCDACKKTVALSKKVAIKSLPNTLIVHLNRICFDLDTLTNKKINDRFEFPTTLNLRQYMLDEVMA
jgi:ubiquitin carboxyl-terminal hydrolase 34